MFLYKLCWIEEDTDVFDAIEILTESQLRTRLEEEIEDNKIDEEVLSDYNLDDLDICDVMDIFDSSGYDVEQFEIDITLDEFYD